MSNQTAHKSKAGKAKAAVKKPETIKIATKDVSEKFKTLKKYLKEIAKQTL